MLMAPNTVMCTTTSATTRDTTKMATGDDGAGQEVGQGDAGVAGSGPARSRRPEAGDDHDGRRGGEAGDDGREQSERRDGHEHTRARVSAARVAERLAPRPRSASGPPGAPGPGTVARPDP